MAHNSGIYYSLIKNDWSNPSLSRRFGYCALVVTFLVAPVTSSAQESLTTNQTSGAIDFEHLLISAMQDVSNQRLDLALEKTQTLITFNPKFKLAQLLYADILSAQAGEAYALGRPKDEQSVQLEALRAEANKRWQHQQKQTKGKLPAYLLEIDNSQQYAVIIDLHDARLYLYENSNSGPRLINDYYVSIGLKGTKKRRQGDQRTPVGVYFITEHLPAEELPDFYGAGAFPINYPNEWDRQLGNSGYGIWLHGTPYDMFSRAPQASDGCITLTNEDFVELARYIDVRHTPVIISEKVKWVNKEQVYSEKNDIKQELDRWKESWESRNIDNYLGYYSRDFQNRARDYAAWEINARASYADASFIKITLSDVSIFHYPGEEMVVATFNQGYQSNNVPLQQSKKRQYWKRDDDDKWRIIYEGPA